MPRNGSGLYVPPPANYPAVPATLIIAANRNAIDADIATALTNSIAVNGESVVTADIPFGNNKLTGVKDGTSAKDAANVSQIQNSNAILLATVAGTDTITASLSPALTAYANGQIFTLIPANSNTGAVTININGLGAKSITKNGSTALVAGDLVAGVEYSLQYDGTRFQKVAGSDYAKSGANSDITSLTAITSISGLTSVNGGQIGFRNKIINGNMGIYQRGTGAVTVSGRYGPADRWKSQAFGNTFSTTQGSFVSGDTLFDTGGAQYFTQCAVTSVAGAGNYTSILQKIEDVRILAGKTVTVSFWAKASSGTPSIGVQMAQNFGTGGSAQVDGTGQAQALSTTWTKYTKTFTIPSINGKTVGTEATHSTALVFWLDSGSTFNTLSGSIGQSSKTVSIAQVQLEVGSVATEFEFRPYGLELSLCQRYYEAGSFNTVSQGTSTYAGQFVSYMAIKRAVPTVVLYDAALNAGKLSIDAVNNNNAIASVFTNGARIGLNNVAVSPSKFITGSYTAEAEI